MEINPVKGTHDIIADEAEMYAFFEYDCRIIAELYGYKEIRTPIIEHTPLFLRSVGESSDIVTKEMYTFTDKGDRSLTLRPEMTAGVMRSIVSNKLYANADLPLKYYYCGPCFRYERPQAGRYRQFHQFGIEMVGASSFYQDAEVISLGARILQSLGIENVKVIINSLGDEKSRQGYRAALKEYFAKHIKNMCGDCKRRYEINPLRILDCKVPEDQEIIKGAPKMKDYLSKEANEYFDKVLEVLKKSGVEVEIDDNLVRGLDYYTGIVFEYHMSDDDIGAIGAGGHYKNLLKEVGGPDLEGVGLSFGLERLAYVFNKVHPNEKPSSGPDFFIMPMNDETVESAYFLADILRGNGFAIEMNYSAKSFKTSFKIAERKRAKFAIILGDDEIANKQITVKNLKTQEQTIVKNDDMVEVFKSLLDEYIRSENMEQFAVAGDK